MTDYVPGRVSVIVPAYNHAAYVRECIDSALNQTYPDVEVVVVDDGSTDGTYEILQTYGDRITLIRQENRGTQAARNTAIRASTGSSSRCWTRTTYGCRTSWNGRYHFLPTNAWAWCMVTPTGWMHRGRSRTAAVPLARSCPPRSARLRRS